jgi:hypothetical protein
VRARWRASEPSLSFLVPSPLVTRRFACDLSLKGEAMLGMG